MWRCPECGREFRNTGQKHYCAAVPVTVDEYIAQAPQARREVLQRVREVIREAAPNATEKISWRMPTFWQGGNLIHFAVSKNHLGLYPGDGAVSAFAGQLADGGYKYSKGTIQLPWDKPIPYELIAQITRFRVAQAEGR